MVILAEDIKGLSASEVRQRNEKGERNRFSVRPTRTYFQIIWANVFSLYNVILFGSFLALLLLRGPGSSIFPAAVVLINSLLGLFQEIRAKRALDQLATLSVRTVTVRRDGRSTSVPVPDIVYGDVIELHPGEAIVVDGTLLAADSLEIDESQLTGESEYVAKQKGQKVTSGSFCVAGAGLMRAEKIGDKSYVNNLAEVARAYKNVRTPLEQNLDALVKVLVAIMIVLAPLTLIGGSLRGTPLPESVENVVNLISSLVPQGLLVFVAISFAFSAVNISRYRALIQRPNAIELMGHVTCLCADKTGTLTENRLVVQGITPLADSEVGSVNEKLRQYVSNISWHNRTVGAIASALGTPNSRDSKVAEVPFNSERKWSSVTFSGGETLVLGAPERMPDAPKWQEEVKRLSEQGLRVVAFAISGEQPEAEKDSLPAGSNCIALIALQDELRPDIRDTLRQFEQQGIAVKIISGDNPETIRSTVHQAGMPDTYVLTGPEVEQMDDARLDEAVAVTSLFARITPQDKRRIVAALAAHGPVAMIGDGVNDVPALKRANLAIAMNDGAQIAKDVSDMILLNNAFSTLPRAFFEGREITQRLYGIARIHLTKVIYLTILFVLAGYAGLAWPANLLQTSWLSLITLTIPAMLIIFRWLPIPLAENRPQQVLRYILSWGIIAALVLAGTEIIAAVWFRDAIPVTRTVIILMASLYDCLILWDIYRIDPFVPASLAQNVRAALAGLILAAISVALPVYVLAGPLGLAPLGLREFLLLAVALALAYLSTRFFAREK